VPATSFANLLGVAAIAFAAPFLLGFFPRIRLPAVVLEIVAGIVVGAASALGLSRLLSGLLFGVAPTDPVSFCAAIATLVAVALFASYLPIRRALRVDAADALRHA